MNQCRTGIALGPELLSYSFPGNHPMNSRRIEPFMQAAYELAKQKGLKIYRPEKAEDSEILTFHEKSYLERVKLASETGMGYLDYGDTPAFIGIYEASSTSVGSTLALLRALSRGEIDHAFNPVGGLHHAMPGAASGFCVFNDAAIAIKISHEKLKFEKVLYVDIDAHHGDGVYYPYETEPWVYVADIHEDGRFLFPGSGFSHEDGRGKGKGTKLNIPLPPGAGDKEFFQAFDEAFDFCRKSKPDIVFFQAGADGLRGDLLTHLRYSEEAHRYAAKKLHELAHQTCQGRLLVMGGGGYTPANVKRAWMAVLEEIS